MEYNSTRSTGLHISASEAIAMGLAPDGGLFVPDTLPPLDGKTLAELLPFGYGERAKRILKIYLPEYSPQELDILVASSYGANFDTAAIAPVRSTDELTSYLELWHGPTSAFKDMALQMLPHLLTTSLKKCGEQRGVCILVATSGDTGKAALEGFADVPGTKILVFYPRDGVSDVQKLQMVTQTGNNVGVCAVEGNFDDAQTGVKRIFGDRELAERLSEKGWFLSSANSINWGRLLPQIVYYFSAYCDVVNSGRIKCGEPVNFCVPTGNFGNILAGWMAKEMGLPVKRFICASNANNVLTDFIETGVYDRRRPFHLTTSPSMDILVSSNLERLLYFLSKDPERVAGWMKQLSEEGRYDVGQELKTLIRRDFEAGYCDDAGTAEEIARVWREHGYLIDTHTAVASRVLGDYRARTGDKTPAIVVSTASPYKFCDSVLRALGEQTDAPGTELIGRLEKATGTTAPAPLSGLAGKNVRFDACVTPAEQKKVVEDFLG